MSKKIPTLLVIFVVFGCALQIFTQTGRPSIEITVKDARTILVTIHSSTYGQSVTFAEDYAGVTGLSRRISNLTITGPEGNPMIYRSLSPGVYLTNRSIRDVRYEVDITPPANAADRAHVSWMAEDNGMLMLGDLLPQNSDRVASVRLILLPGWSAASPDLNPDGITMEIPNAAKSVIFLTKNLRRSNHADVAIATSEEWQFSDQEAREVTSEIVASYTKIFGPLKSRKVQIVFVKIRDVPPGTWRAETRGQNILIASADMPFKSQAVQRLHEQLRHEIFHLWIPNGLNLTGNYDWFYEGFALYQSLRLGVESNRIRFEDFLDTLSRATFISNETHRPVSLIEASNQRWAGNATPVYTRGMVVAFLCDLAMLDASKGKRGITEMLGDLYRENAGSVVSSDAKTVVLAKLRSYPELVPVIERYITGTDTFALIDFLGHAGLRLEVMRPYSRLVVGKELSGRQKVVLDRLGYNSWRKLSQQKK